MSNLAVVEYDNRRVLTSNQLAQAYETEPKVISNNFNRNKERYVEGKHFYVLEGGKLKDFRTNHQIEDYSKNTPKLYLWTQNGTLLHAKSLNTDKAWEVYQNLVDFYFNIREKATITNSDPQPQLPDQFKYDTSKIFKLVDNRLNNIEEVTDTLLDQVEKLILFKNTIINNKEKNIVEQKQPINQLDELRNTSVQFYETLRNLATIEDGYIGDEYVLTLKRLLGRFKNKKLILKNKFDEQTVFENFQYEYHPAVEYGSAKSFAYFLLKCTTTGTYKRIFVCDIKEVKGRKLFLTDCTLRYELF